LIARTPRPEEPRPVRGFSFLGRTSAALQPEWLLGILLGLLYVAAIAALRLKAPFTDEVDHFGQITLFRRGEFRLLPELTTIPGYHVAIAAILRVFGASSIDAARCVNAAFGLLAAAGFHALRRRAWPGTETTATAQFLVLPILVPLFFVVYTDVLALALLLWAAWASVARRTWISALLLTLLVGVRQHEIIWAGLVVPLAAWPQSGVQGLRDWRRVLPLAIPYALPVVCFLAFWAWNGSISLSSTQAALHPDLSVHAGNLYFALLVAGLLLPLHVLDGLRGFTARLLRQPWLAALPLMLFAGFWFGFRADNPYNTAYPAYYLHNHLPMLIEQRPWIRAFAAAVVAATACGLASTRLLPTSAYWLFPTAALFLAASWLVELRYALVPLVLWLAFREQRNRSIEYATLALWLVLAVCMIHGTVTNRFFL
jgi:alpha-1,2-glucosyltransferase